MAISVFAHSAAGAGQDPPITAQDGECMVFLLDQGGERKETMEEWIVVHGAYALFFLFLSPRLLRLNLLQSHDLDLL